MMAHDTVAAEVNCQGSANVVATHGTLWNRAAVVGSILLVSYFVVRQWLPDTGVGEFAYAPFTAEFHWFAPMRGFTVEQFVSHLLRIALLGPSLWMLSLGLARALQWSPETRVNVRSLLILSGVCSLMVTAYVMFFVLRGRAIIDDEVTYAAMARTFSRGVLAEPAYWGSRLDVFEIVTKLGITGKYLFGEPLVQIAGVLVGTPPLLHLVLNAITLTVLYASVRAFWADRAVAAWSCALLALSPAFMLCAATGLSQSTALTCVAVSILGYAQAFQRGRWWGGSIAGLAVAFGLTVRVQTMVPVAAALGGCFALSAYRAKRFAALGGFIATSLLGVIAIGAYNQVLSGNPLTLPWFMQRSALEHYGFGRVWDDADFVHTPLGGLQNLFVVAVRMNAWWLGWPLAFVIAVRRSAWVRVKKDAPVFLAVSLAIVLFELGYYSTGVSDVGPLYHFELLLTLSIVGAHAIAELVRSRPALAVAGVIVHLLLGTGSFIYEESSRLGRLANTIHAEPERIVASLPRPSLILYESSCSDVIQIGWMQRAYVLANRDPRAEIVSYGRPVPEVLDSFIARFPGRSCFYMHRSEDRRLRTDSCRDARALLMRPIEAGNDASQCLYLVSTAERLGLTWR